MNKIALIALITFVFSNLDNSKFYYIDQIDKIKELEFLYEESLNMGDTLKSIDILLNILDEAESSDYYSDQFISNYYYKIGHLYLLINNTNKSEQFFLKSIESYNNAMLKNQLLMEAPLFNLQSIYKSKQDSIELNVVLKRIDKIKSLKNNSLLDSVKYESLDIETFDESIKDEEEISIYSNIELSQQAFNQGLYSKSIEILSNSLNFDSEEIEYEYYYNTPVLDSINIEYIYPALDNLLKLDTLNSSHIFFNSIINIKTQDYDNALVLAEKYYKYQPLDIKSYQLLADIYFKKKEWDKSLFYYFRILLHKKEDLELRFKIANCMQYGKYYDDAINSFQYILDKDPSFYNAYLELGKLYIIKKDYKKAQKILTEFLLFEPNSKDGYYNLGVAYFKLNKYNFAIDAFNKTIKLDNSQSNAHYYLGLINESILKYDKAIYHYDKARLFQTSFYEVNFNYGHLLYNLEEYKKAIDPLTDYVDYFQYDNISIMSDDYKNSLIMMGDIFFTQNRYSESIDIYDRLIEQYPEDLFFNTRLAESFSSLKNDEKSIQIYKTILNLYSEDINSMLRLGDIFFNKNDYDNALAYYHQAISCNNNNKDALYKTALCYAYTGRFFQSLIAFKRAHIIEPEDFIVMYQIGVTYMELNLYEQAIPYFKNYKNDLDSQFMLGICYYELNKYQQSLDYFRLYLEDEKNNSQLYYYLGLCYYFLNDYKKAAKNFKTSLKIDDSNVDALSKIGESYIKLGKKREAQKIANKLYYLDKIKYNTLNEIINE